MSNKVATFLYVNPLLNGTRQGKQARRAGELAWFWPCSERRLIRHARFSPCTSWTCVTRDGAAQVGLGDPFGPPGVLALAQTPKQSPCPRYPPPPNSALRSLSSPSGRGVSGPPRREGNQLLNGHRSISEALLRSCASLVRSRFDPEKFLPGISLPESERHEERAKYITTLTRPVLLPREQTDFSLHSPDILAVVSFFFFLFHPLLFLSLLLRVSSSCPGGLLLITINPDFLLSPKQSRPFHLFIYPRLGPCHLFIHTQVNQNALRHRLCCPGGFCCSPRCCYQDPGRQWCHNAWSVNRRRHSS